MNYTKALSWIVKIGLCLIPLVAFIVADGMHFPANMFFPYITGKNFMFRILVEIVFALYVLLALREPKYRPRSSYLMWAVALFTLWMALATFTSVDGVKSFWSNFERMEGYITVIHLFALFVVAGAVLTAERWWNTFWRVSVFASAIQGLYALFQVLHWFGFSPSSQSGNRADTTFGNAIYLAVYMLFMIFITAYLLYRERDSRLWRWIYAVAIVLQLVGLFFTETRGALLGVVGGAVVAGIYVALFARGSQWRTYRTYAWWGIGAVAVLVVGFLLVKDTSFVKSNNTLSRLASISLVDKTTQARFMIWGEAWQGFKQKPILGWGQENFSYVFNNYYNPHMYDQEQWFDRAHNAFVDWAIAGGAPAFVLYVSFFVLAAWALYKSELEIPEQAIFLGLLAGYAFNNLTVFDNITSYIYFFLVLAFIHSISRKELPSAVWLTKATGDRTLAVAAPVMLVLLVVSIWQLNAPGMARAQDLIGALTPTTAQGAQKTPQQILGDFGKVLDMGPLGYQESVEQLFQLSSNSVAASTNLSPDIKKQAFDMTKAAGDNLLSVRPGDARLELFYAVFLSSFAQYPGAIEHLNAALKDSPQKQQLLFQVGSIYIQTGDFKDALPPLKQAYEEDTNYDVARTLYAAGLIYNGQTAQADQLLTEKFGSANVDSQPILQAYFATKQYGRLAAIYANRIAQNPKDAGSMIAHGAIQYLVDGNKQKAIAEIQKGIATDPSVAAQGQSFIDQINNGTLKP